MSVAILRIVNSILLLLSTITVIQSSLSLGVNPSPLNFCEAEAV